MTGKYLYETHIVEAAALGVTLPMWHEITDVERALWRLTAERVTLAIGMGLTA